MAFDHDYKERLTGSRPLTMQEIHEQGERDKAGLRLAVVALICASVLGAFVVAMT